MAVLKLQLDKPMPGCLKFGKGKFCESKFPGGDYYMYSLVSGDVMFLEEKICDEPDGLFAAADVAKGDPFIITLRKSRTGGKFYQVQKLSDAAEPAPEPSKLERDLAASITDAQRKAASSSKSTPPSAATVITPGPSQQNHPIAIVPERPRAGSLMASALVASIDAVLIAQDYADAKGLAVKFGAEDIRAIAATLYIQHSKAPYAAAGGAR